MIDTQIHNTFTYHTITYKYTNTHILNNSISRPDLHIIILHIYTLYITYIHTNIFSYIFLCSQYYTITTYRTIGLNVGWPWFEKAKLVYVDSATSSPLKCIETVFSLLTLTENLLVHQLWTRALNQHGTVNIVAHSAHVAWHSSDVYDYKIDMLLFRWCTHRNRHKSHITKFATVFIASLCIDYCDVVNYCFYYFVFDFSNGNRKWVFSVLSCFSSDIRSTPSRSTLFCGKQLTLYSLFKNRSKVKDEERQTNLS